MKNEELIRQVDFSIFDRIKDINMYPNRIALFESLNELGLGREPSRIHGAALAICIAGSCTIEIDLKHYRLIRGHAIVIVPDQIVQLDSLSADFQLLCLAVSNELINDLTYKVENLTQFILTAKDNSLLTLDEQENRRLVDSYLFLKNKLEGENTDIFQKRMLEHLLISIFYECHGFFQQKIKQTEESSSRKEKLFNAFIKLVIENHRLEHTPAYYADKLSVTPKYLSVVTETISGKSVKRWIDEYIILDAKVLLTSSDKTIQQIADELNFPDASFFGKYFKRILKISPKEYRKNKLSGLTE